MADRGTVLVINDDPSITDRLKRWLAAREYIYVMVDSDEQARALLLRKRFDLIVHGHELLFPSPLSLKFW